MKNHPFILSALAIALTSPLMAFSATLIEATTQGEQAKIGTTIVEQAFSSQALRLSGSTENVLVQPGSFPAIKVGERSLLVVPIANEGSIYRHLKVKSSIVTTDDGKLVMFYPVVSLVDNGFRIYQTIKPKHQFVFDGNILTNEFEIPTGAGKLLLHTEEEYLTSGFVGETYPSGGPSGGAYGVAGALGGLVGALLLHAIAGGTETKQFTFGEIGELAISAD